MQGNTPIADTRIEQIYVLLNEIKEEQQSLAENLQKKFNVIMNKTMKIEEYNKISDMTNQVFEMRLSNIEDFLYRIENDIRNMK